ncbi:MAG: HAMP domain-containing histidine kinase [Verrucomicrobiae bacterium]|nr:HAMP domain-containing histidine kinase [Verrucomicrobiae bacterium]
MKLPLHWKWFLGLVASLAVLLLVIYLWLGNTLPPYLESVIRDDLQRNAILVRQTIAPKLAATPVETAGINTVTHALAQNTGLRITIMTADGTVIGESDKPVEAVDQIENHLQRSEVQEAIRRGVGSAKRHSATVDLDLLYVAIPVKQQDGLLGFVRVALPLLQVAQANRHVSQVVGIAAMGVGVLAIPFLFLLSRRALRPIQQMSEFTDRIERGQFPKPLQIEAAGEIGHLASALNAMAAQLEARLRELAAEKAELTAIMASMTEGVLVVDANGKIRLVNEALRRQFEVTDEAIGRTVLEAFRNVALQEFIAQANEQGTMTTREVVFLNPEEQTFDVAAACLRASDSRSAGTVVVFHDITRIKKLENIRKEFVANVSHELRTPLSIIKGYIETLLDDEPPDPETSKQFLQTIQKHSRRLEALIDDLLTISSLESQQAKLTLAPVSLHSTAEAAAEELSKQARTKSITIVVEIPKTFPVVRADAQRLHQVFSNLIDNAIKYTQAGGRVTVSANQKEGEVEVCITDNGPGIAPEHLPRIFERFYRADKARSRELGGTGLGLSIVKHIVQAHGGRVWAESELDKGSRFLLTLVAA